MSEPETKAPPSLEELEAAVYKTAARGLAQSHAPGTPDPTYLYAGQGKTWAYYKSVDWPAWWDEFNGALIPKKQKGAGKRKYRTVWSFIQEKTKIKWQKQLLWQMIGPEPTVKPGERLKCPYLGDWDKRRRNGFYVFDDPTKVAAVELAIQERQMGLTATRALIPMIVGRLAYWYKIRQTLTEAFGMDIVGEENSPTGSGKNRVDLFLKWQEKVENIIEKLEQQYAGMAGVDLHDSGQQYLEMAMTTGKVATAAALTGAQAAGGLAGRPKLVQDGVELPLPEGTTYDAILMAQMLKGHETNFPDLPLPQETKKGKSKTQ